MYQLRQSVFIHLSRFSLGNNCSRIIDSKSNKLRRKGAKDYIYVLLSFYFFYFVDSLKTLFYFN